VIVHRIVERRGIDRPREPHTESDDERQHRRDAAVAGETPPARLRVIDRLGDARFERACIRRGPEALDQ